MPSTRSKPSLKLFPPAAPRYPLCLLVLVLASAGLYLNGLPGGFVWDDRSLVLQNPFVQNAGNLLDAFRQPLVLFGRNTGYYRPVSVLSLALDQAVWKGNALGFHLTNLVLHLAVIAGIALLFGRLLGRYRGLAVAGLFSSFAVHVENVSFISGRMDILASLFVLFSLSAYFMQKEHRGVVFWKIGLCSLLLLISLLSKEMAVVYPALFAVIVLFFFPRQKWKYHFLKGAVISGCAFAAYLVIRLSLAGLRFTAAGAGSPLIERLLIAPRTILLYVQLVLFPYNLNARHTLDLNDGSYLFNSAWPLLVIAGLAWLTILVARYRRVSAFGAAWFACGIMPVLNIVPLSGFAIAERFLYLPSVGIALALSGLLFPEKTGPPAGRWAYRIAAAALLLVALINAIYTVRRNPVWRDEKIFFSRMVEQSPLSALAHHNLGHALYREGNMTRAESEYRKALAVNPAFAETHAALGDLYYRTGRFRDALQAYSNYLGIAPDAANRGETLARIRLLRALVAKDSQQP